MRDLLCSGMIQVAAGAQHSCVLAYTPHHLATAAKPVTGSVVEPGPGGAPPPAANARGAGGPVADRTNAREGPRLAGDQGPGAAGEAEAVAVAGAGDAAGKCSQAETLTDGVGGVAAWHTTSCYCWGWNGHGQCGVPLNSSSSSNGQVAVPTAVAALGGVDLVAVAAGMAHTAVLSADGACYCFGW